MHNIQVTRDLSPNNARSESSIVINPRNPLQMVAGSKKFRDPHNYDFILATEYSNDGGLSWHDSADLTLTNFTLLTDPALAWDDAGNVFLVGLSGNNPPTFDVVGIVVYKSTDGGRTWSAPKPIHNSTGDDKQWAAGDGNVNSPYHGRVYAVWDDGSDMRFARTLDHGNSWVGTAAHPSPGAIIEPGDSFSPEINVAADGTIYVVWLAGETGNKIKMVVSRDGGDSFQPAASPASGITNLWSSLPQPHGWPVFPGGNFRVITAPTACVSGQIVAVAWADYREGVSRIYYALSTNGGASWVTGASGRPLLTGALPANQQHFHPQIIGNPSGVIGCAFYEFGPKPSVYMIDVILAKSFDHGSTFSQHVTVTDRPWDPTVDAPWSHGDSNVTFIGDYFGLDASNLGFYSVWTDTRTGIQELWTDAVTMASCIKSDFDGDGRDDIFVSSPWGIGILKLSGNTLHVPMMAPNGTRFNGWLLNTADNLFGPVGDFDGDGKAEIMVSSPWGIGVLRLAGNTLHAVMMAPNGTRFNGWLLNTADNLFGPVGDFDGDGKAEIMVSSPWGIGMLKLSGNTLHVPMMAPNGTRFNGWLLNTADNRFGPVGDFDASGRDEIFISSPWGIGVLKLAGNTLNAIMMAANGTRFDGWLLNTADNRFGPVGDFDASGRDDIFISSPWGVGMLKLSGNTLHVPMMAPNGTRFNGWLLNTADNRFGPVCNFEGGGQAEIMVSSPWGIGILKLSGNTLHVPMMAANGTRFNGWLLNTADNRFGPVGDFDGAGQGEIMISSPWGIGMLKLSGKTLHVPMMAPNGTRFDEWLLNTADNHFYVSAYQTF